MPNATDGIFSRIKGLERYCAEQRQKFGLGAPDIARMATARFKTPITEDQVAKRLKRIGKWDYEPGVIAGLPDDLVVPDGGFAVDVRKAKVKHPEGWEPHVEENGDTAVAISKPTENGTPNEQELIQGWNLNPAEWAIVGNVNCRRWQANVPVEEDSTDCRCEPKQAGRHYEERWLYYYKANLARRTSQSYVDVDALCQEIKTHKPRKQEPPKGDTAFAICISDTQMGKDDQGGSSGIARRFLDRIGMAQDRARDLRKLGVPLGTLYVFGLGDLIENCSDRYPMQQFRVELPMREQVKVMRRLIVQGLREWAPLFDRVVVAAVGGNHGENRKDGKSFTSFSDNEDVAIFEQVQEIFAENQHAYGHVSFVIPNDRLDVTLDVAGTITALAHGHQAERGATPAQKIDNWWMKQAHGQQPTGDAQLLLTGHFHHLLVNQSGTKTHIQCPALEGGSDWWRNQTGQQSIPGMLTLAIGKNMTRDGVEVGWDHLRVL